MCILYAEEARIAIASTESESDAHSGTQRVLGIHFMHTLHDCLLFDSSRAPSSCAVTLRELRTRYDMRYEVVCCRLDDVRMTYEVDHRTQTDALRVLPT